MKLEIKTNTAKIDATLRIMLTYFLLFTQIILASAMPDPIGIESIKSVNSTHSCAIKISRTIPATTPTEKIKSISFICYVSRKLFVCLSRGDREGTGQVLTDRMVTRKEG
jgi:hypothetical protein